MSETPVNGTFIPADIASGTVLEPSQARQTTVTRSPKTQRIAALDFTKGSLVLIMVLYHWLNYFVGLQGSFYRYLRFLPPSFIFITGFLISHLYLSRQQVPDARLSRRVLIRGLKVLGVFIALNAVISLVFPDRYNGRPFLESFSLSTLKAIYVTGSFPTGRVAAFYVLVPISYLLILSAGLLLACRYYRYAFHLALVCFMVSVPLLGRAGIKSGNLEMLTIGLLGVSVGYIRIDIINKLFRHSFALVFAYVLYTAAITVWDVSYTLQIVGVCLTLMLIYMLGTISGESGRTQRAVILLGKYSLFGYIAQIAILQVLRRGLRGMGPEQWKLAATFLVAVALTVIAVKMLDRMRARAAILNRLYMAVFS
jgi:peptidoglycan/LPS O-acetylase OafA/YrhL